MPLQRKCILFCFVLNQAKTFVLDKTATVISNFLKSQQENGHPDHKTDDVWELSEVGISSQFITQSSSAS